MDAVSHREMRNNSAEVLRRVEAGETLLVTNRGRAAAVIGPVGRSTLDDLVERGEARAATSNTDSLRSIRRRRADRSSADLLADSRGAW